MTLIEKIMQAVTEGILGSELCPTEHYWHWPVIDPTSLKQHSPALFEAYERYGEVRWYGSDNG